MLRGFDISAYQGTTAPSGADFIIVKATEGASYTNGKYAAQIASARTKAKVVGAYHFARPEESSGASQADRFLAAAKPGPRDLLCLDLEASKLSQAKTNAWAIAFAARLKDLASGNTRILYMGSGYASSGTGRDLSEHFSFWWFPQYPSTARTSTWPSAMTPWLPSGLTCGWQQPHIWQFTDNFGGLDASVTALTLDQLAGGGQPIPQEDTDMAQRDVRDGLGQRSGLILTPKSGGYTYFEAFADNTLDDGKQVKPFAPVTIRVAIEKSDGHWQTVSNLVVGRGTKDTTQPRARIKLDDKNSVAVSVTRVTGDGTEPITITAY